MQHYGCEQMWKQWHFQQFAFNTVEKGERDKFR
jgi:hypothetical protein